MATVRHRAERDTWEVRWSERRVAVVDGLEVERWVDRRRQAPSKRVAEALAREVEAQLALSGSFTPAAERPVRLIGELCEAYVASSIVAQEPSPTTRFRAAMLTPLEDFAGRRPVSDLGVELLRAYAASLPSEGRAAATRHRQVLEAERAWAWAHRARSEWPDLPPPERVTGALGEVRPPPPLAAVAAPTWRDVDAFLGGLRLGWHRSAALIQRYTGLRVSQVLGLRVEDVDLQRGVLRVRAGARGAKRGRARVLPLHPALARELGAWLPEAGLLFPRRYRTATGEARTGPYRGDVLVAPYRRAWEAAGVARDRWDAPAAGERAKGAPTHALRRALRTELLRAGVEEPVVLYLVGQSQGVTGAAYVPESSPEQSPWWPRLVAAVASIPEHGQPVLRVVEGG